MQRRSYIVCTIDETVGAGWAPNAGCQIRTFNYDDSDLYDSDLYDDTTEEPGHE